MYLEPTKNKHVPLDSTPSLLRRSRCEPGGCRCCWCPAGAAQHQTGLPIGRQLHRRSTNKLSHFGWAGSPGCISRENSNRRTLPFHSSRAQSPSFSGGCNGSVECSVCTTASSSHCSGPNRSRCRINYPLSSCRNELAGGSGRGPAGGVHPRTPSLNWS